ncbi:MAG TPA: aspartate:alanine exchanger family transporter [Anaeromyxobacteraceae bacterium]|nr:aspartate:alanine exchanger family transporter [Anaeromyxobacteraceae bacterium]
MVHALAEQPVLVLFLVAAIGFPLGQVQVRGISLGVSAVLFVGLAFGAADPALRLPEIVYLLGLTLFVYTIGLSSGPAFVASLRHEGWKYNLLAVVVVLLGTFLTVGASALLKTDAALAAGLLSGALTSTPALAGALETLKRAAPPEQLDQLLAEPVVGYSVAYPVGVVGVVLAIALCQRLWRVDYAAEARQLRKYGGGNEPILNRTVHVLRRRIAGSALGELVREYGWQVQFGRIKRGGRFVLADPDERVQLGDLVTVVGTGEELDRVTAQLGEESDDHIDLDRREYDQRRLFVSNPDVAGRRLGDLDLARHEAVVTRVRRGDADLLPNDDMVLELGDRVRVVARHDRMPELTAFFGDSYRSVTEIDLFTFGVGLALGLALGAIPIPLPGGVRVSLGFAGGPLVVALVLGTIGRTGAVVWSLPYAANMTLRQIGLVFFLAGIGTRAGGTFVKTLTGSGGLALFAAGAAITCISALAALWIGHKLMGIPMTLLIGMVAGIQTQAAVVGYALEQTGNDLPSVGYAAVYPIAMLSKILLVQILLLVLL